MTRAHQCNFYGGRAADHAEKRFQICPTIKIDVGHAAAVLLRRSLVDVDLAIGKKQDSTVRLHRICIYVLIDTPSKIERAVGRTKKRVHCLAQ